VPVFLTIEILKNKRLAGIEPDYLTEKVSNRTLIGELNSTLTRAMLILLLTFQNK